MNSRPVAALAALTLAGAVAACGSDTEDQEAATPPSPSGQAASVQADLDAAAQECPDAITSEQLAAAIDEATGFVLPDDDPLGRISYAGLFPPVWESFATEDQSPDNLADSVHVLGALACDSAAQVRENGDLTVTGIDTIELPNSTVDPTLSAATWATVYLGPTYIEQTGGVDLDSPVAGPSLNKVLPGTLDDPAPVPANGE